MRLSSRCNFARARAPAHFHFFHHSSIRSVVACVADDHARFAGFKPEHRRVRGHADGGMPRGWGGSFARGGMVGTVGSGACVLGTAAAGAVASVAETPATC